MPRAEGTKAYTTFVRGLITEAGPLTFPDNASKDEDNCVLLRKGNRKRRLGCDYEPSYSLSTASFTDANRSSFYITTHVWTAVAGDGNRNFLAVQIGGTIYYYDLATSPLSSGMKSFTTSLSTYLVSGGEAEQKRVAMASGKGFLFVVGSDTEPFYVEYNSDTDTISETQIDIKIRDFEGLDDGLETEEEPATLSDEHSYNLKNQGWNSPGEGVADPVTTYFSSKSKYPPNSKQWWVGKDSNDNFSASILAKYSQGNMEAPRGHYILKAFYKDRSNVSGIAGIAVESESKRPKAVAFFSGRVFYAGTESSKINGDIFFSQVIERDELIGRCYQSGDPTSEDIPDLLDTDGGVINIPEIGTVEALFEMKKGLLVMANNGIWMITGPDDGFKATNFIVNKISSVGIEGAETIVDVEGVPFWWAEQGIYTIGADQISQEMAAQNISEQTIQTFYNDIDSLAKVYAKGIFDPANKVIRWFYADTQTGNDDRHQYTKVLNLDLSLGAFYPWTISELTSNTPHIASAFTIPSLTLLTEDFQVVDSSSNSVEDSSTNLVIATGDTVRGGSTQTGILSFAQTATDTNKYTFALFSSTDFTDWASVTGTGADYDSYLETGYELAEDIARFKQAPYIITYFNRTEESWVSDGAGGFELSPQSACLGRAKWDWADEPYGKWSSQFVAYRIIPTPTDPGEAGDFENGKPVVITRNKIRGKGRALSIRYDSQTGKDFDLLGWFIPFSGNTRI